MKPYDENEEDLRHDAAVQREIDERPSTSPTFAARFSRMYRPSPSGCWLWTGALSSNGYGQFSRGGRELGAVTAHRASYELHRGPIPDGMQVCHRCDVRQCVNPDHLFLGTPKDNMADAAVKGRMPRGEQHAGVKLTATDVLAIRADARSQRAIAKHFGIAQTLVSLVKRLKVWRHV